MFRILLVNDPIHAGKKSILAGMLMFLVSALSAQSISPEEARMLTAKLSQSKPDTAQVSILLKLAKYHVFKPGENKNDLDSAAAFISRAEKTNVSLKSNWANGYILLIRSYLLRESGQGEQAREIAKQAARLLKQQPDKFLAGEAYFEYSGYFTYTNTVELEERIRLVDTAVSFFQKAGDLEKLGASLHMLGDLHNINGSPFIALQKLKQSLDVYATAKHDGVQGIQSLIGRIYTRQGDYKNALMYQLSALRTAEKVGDSSIQMCMVNNDIAQTFLSLSEHQKAMFYYEKALAVAEKYNDHKAVYMTGCLIATAWTKLNKPLVAVQVLNKLSIKYKKPDDPPTDALIARTYIRSYCMLKEYKKAEPYCEQLLNFVRTLDMNDYSTIQCYAEAIWFYIQSSQYELAAMYLRKHQALTEKVSDLEQMANSHKLWFMLDTSRRDYRSAVNHLTTYKKLSDSLLNETKTHQIAELQVQYDTEKKEKDILVRDQNIQLLTREQEVQKAGRERDQVTIYAVIAGAGLLLLILLLGYSRYRQKQKSNIVISIKNQQLEHLLTEKEWLLKEIHHRVKNNLQTVISLLNSQTAYIDNEPALTAIHDSEHRVQAMALIHQKLYGSENVSSIDMSVYIRELVSYLADSFGTGQRIRFTFDIEAIQLDVSQAVPLGLILNEAITNSIKYAFPGGRSGIVALSLKLTEGKQCQLTIADNGIGMPSIVDGQKPGSLGMSLIRGLSDDLNGQLTISRDQGTNIKILFTLDNRIGKTQESMGSSFVSHN